MISDVIKDQIVEKQTYSVRTRSLILLVLLVPLAILGAAWLMVQLCLAADFNGKVVGIIDGDTIETLNGHHAERIRSAASTALRRAKPTATMPSTRPLILPSGKKSPSRRMATPSTSASLEMRSCLMGPTSITRWSRRMGLDNLSEPPYQPTRGTHWGKRGSTRLFPSG